ncbi:MAG: hypothetical protein QMD04_01965 [Anaerolineales bacterium]|nr:hypothetical protein [Anaerolineales bacterium]
MTDTSPAERFLHIYCDESRQTADRYMVLGGLITFPHQRQTSQSCPG